MAKELSQEKLDKYDKILKDSSIEAEKDKLTKDELVEIKSYAITKKLKLNHKYVRN